MALQSAALHSVRITPKTCWSFLRLHTQEGRTGAGEATLGGQDDMLLAAAEHILPTALREATPEEPGGFATGHAPDDIFEASVVSALDQALWDLHAQARCCSVAQCLGVRRNRVPVYANINRRTVERSPEGFAASARAAVAAGHVAVKLAPFDEVTREVCAAGHGGRAMQAGLARVAAVREAVGPNGRLMVDCHWRFDEATAILLNEAAAKLGVYWIECPLPEVEGSIPALIRLRHQCEALGMRQAGLEQSIGWNTMRPYCEAGAYDVVMPDVKYIGGVHELRKVAGACADLGVAVSPHNPSGPISHAFSLQVSATLAAFDQLEMQFDESPLFDALVGAPFGSIVDGLAALPFRSGLGATLSEPLSEKHAERPVREWRR
ncbi:MAG: hypothetical protein OXH15_04200 [Gammaproteobacteria bacterium]|nr:hypothetical protein [Gammaproteobacteria bacterium]